MIPPILASSLAFMLPVATPPNAIAFSYGHLKVLDLVSEQWKLLFEWNLEIMFGNEFYIYSLINE